MLRSQSAASSVGSWCAVPLTCSCHLLLSLPPLPKRLQFTIDKDQLVLALDANPDTIVDLKCPDEYTTGTVYWRTQ